jgi:molybdopterin-guanine dinucleotide biosynthesis protein A
MTQFTADTPFSVIIIAGGKSEDKLATGLGLAHHCLIEIGGRSIISRIVEAFQGVPSIAEVIVVSLPEVLNTLPGGVCKVEAGESAAENISLGLKAAKAEWVVVSPSDIPFLSAEVIGEFLSRGFAAEADLVYPIISREDYEARFPGGRRTYVSLREGTFTGGNMVLVKRTFLEGLLPLIHRLFKYRKNPLLLARALGAGFVAKMLLGRLDIPSIEKRARALTGGRAAALPISRPELAFDIDKPEDLAAAEKTAS